MTLHWDSFMPPEDRNTGIAPKSRNQAAPLSPTIACRYCLTEVPRGALICLGCNARIKYGPTYRTLLSALVGTVALLWVLSKMSLMPASYGIDDVIALAVFAMAYAAWRHADRDRISFRRPWLG